MASDFRSRLTPIVDARFSAVILFTALCDATCTQSSDNMHV
jgi:hypothetical protein